MSAAVLAAVITGGVAFAAIVATVITTLVTLHHQRNLRLLDTALTAAVDFLTASDRTGRARQRAADLNAQLIRAAERANELNTKVGDLKELGVTTSVLENPLQLVKALERLSTAGVEQAQEKAKLASASLIANLDMDQANKDYERAEELADAAYTDAEKAYTAVRLLLRSATEQARRYLDLCNQTTDGETANNEREDARKAAEAEIRRALAQPLLRGRLRHQ